MKKLLISFVAAGFFLVGCSCYQDEPPDDPQPQEEFDVTPDHDGENYDGVEYPPEDE